MGKNTCCTCIRAWVQIPSTYVRSHVSLNTCNPGTVGTEAEKSLGLAHCHLSSCFNEKAPSQESKIQNYTAGQRVLLFSAYVYGCQDPQSYLHIPATHTHHTTHTHNTTHTVPQHIHTTSIPHNNTYTTTHTTICILHNHTTTYAHYHHTPHINI